MREITAINIDLDVTHTSAAHRVGPQAQARGVDVSADHVGVEILDI